MINMIDKNWIKWYNEVRHISGIADLDQYLKHCREYYSMDVPAKVAASHLLECETRKQLKAQ